MFRAQYSKHICLPRAQKDRPVELCDAETIRLLIANARDVAMKIQPGNENSYDAAIAQYTDTVSALPCCYKLVFYTFLVAHLRALSRQPGVGAIFTTLMISIYKLLPTFCCNPIYGEIVNELLDTIARSPTATLVAIEYANERFQQAACSDGKYPTVPTPTVPIPTHS